LVEALAEPGDVDADSGVGLRVERRSPAQNFDRYGVLADAVVAVAPEVHQEFAQQRSLLKGDAGADLGYGLVAGEKGWNCRTPFPV
jgi:hypothetical protein